MFTNWRPVHLMAIGLLTVWLVAALLCSALAWHGRTRMDDGRAALVVAGSEATNFFSLDSHNTSDDVRRVLSLSTGSFRDQYEAQRSAIVSGVRRQSLIAIAHIPRDGIGLEFLHGDVAQALVAVDVTATSATHPKQTHSYRARLHLRREHGAWLVSGLDEVN